MIFDVIHRSRGMYFLMILYLSACSTTPLVEKNIRGPEHSGITPMEKEAFLKPMFNSSMNTEGIYSLNLSPDGRHVAIGRTNHIELWNIVRNEGEKTIESHGIRDITALQFSPDGKFLAVGGYRSVEIWSLPERTLYKRMEGYGDYITTLSFSPDGGLLAAGSRGATHAIRIWEVGSGKVVRTLEWDWKYADEVKAMIFSGDSLRLASVAMDNIIRVWDVRSGVIEKSFVITVCPITMCSAFKVLSIACRWPSWCTGTSRNVRPPTLASWV